MTLRMLQLQTMYHSMKIKVENVVKRGKVGDEYIIGEEEQKAFNKWKDSFTRQDHPTVIQVCISECGAQNISLIKPKL